MNRSTFYIEGMDCAAEEQLVRMRLEGEPDVERLTFDLPGRRVTVVHDSTAPATPTRWTSTPGHSRYSWSSLPVSSSATGIGAGGPSPGG